MTLNVAPLMRTDSPDEKRIQAILDQLTDESRILDAVCMTNKAILSHVLAKASKCAIGWRSTVSRRLF